MPLSLSEKINRGVGFLRGLSHPRVASKLVHVGFGQHVLDEGWTLVRAAATARGAKTAPVTADPTIVAKVDEWENQYFPIAEATLRRHYPAIYQSVFLNLSQTTGPEVLVGVQLLVDRLGALDKAGDKESKAARELLKQRGITKGVMDEAKALLAEASVVGASEETDEEEHATAIDSAEQELWSWYLEWSQIARATIKDGRLLQLLGFGRRGGGAREAVGEEDAEEPSPAPVPDAEPA